MRVQRVVAAAFALTGPVAVILGLRAVHQGGHGQPPLTAGRLL